MQALQKEQAKLQRQKNANKCLFLALLCLCGHRIKVAKTSSKAFPQEPCSGAVATSSKAYVEAQAVHDDCECLFRRLNCFRAAARS